MPDAAEKENATGYAAWQGKFLEKNAATPVEEGRSGVAAAARGSV